MSILELYKFLKESKRLKKLNIETYKTRAALLNSHNKSIKKYPNLAMFAFDRLGVEISLHGVYEKEILENLKSCVFDKIDTQNSVCLDIGANIGNHTLNFSQFFKQVYSFEPHPEIFQLLKFNIRNSKNVQIFEIGASNKNAGMILVSNQNTSYGSSQLSNKKNLSPDINISTFNVQVKKLDDFFNNINKKDNISFIKLDVENHELEALHGMNKILKKNSPIICFEQHADHFDNYDEELSSTVINFLKDNEYLFFYELLSSRDWKFFNNYHPLIEKIIKLLEVLLIGTPKITNKINRINKFSKKKYLAIIASKKQL